MKNIVLAFFATSILAGCSSKAKLPEVAPVAPAKVAEEKKPEVKAKKKAKAKDVKPEAAAPTKI
jgi:outer membrane murein-binding lipoprotein Lpp